MSFSIFLVLIILFVVIFILVFTSLRIEIKNLYISNENTIKTKYDYEIYLKLYLFNKLRYFQIKIDKKKLEKIDITKRIQEINIEKANKELKNIKISAKNLKLEIEKLNLDLKIGTESLFITTGLVLLTSVGLSYIFSNMIRKVNPEKHKYKIEPSYISKNVIDLKFDCIIKVKMVHIITVIYIVLKKRRGLKNERTSNRRLNDDCNEQYPRYGRCKHNYRGTN